MQNNLFDLKGITKDNGALGLKNDYQTPIDVCQYMVSLIPKGVRTVLEPTPGNGNIVSQLDRYEVTAPQDFFLLSPHQRFDCVVMNPPFSVDSLILDNAPTGVDFKGMKSGYWILEQCMQRSDNVIALMPWFTISDSDGRVNMLKEWGWVSITQLPRRTFGYTRIQTLILQLKRGYKGDTSYHIYDLLNNNE